MRNKEVLKSSENVQPWQSYWYYRPTKGFPPKVIQYPREYGGTERLNLACTQTDLSSSKQKKLVQEWCEVLPTLENLRFLWFSSRVSQPLFEAACEIKNLVGLYIKWSGIKSIGSITKLKNLQFLHIGSSPSIAPLDPLTRLPGLEWLELENIRATSNLSFLSTMTNLRGLLIGGDSNSIKYLRPDSLAPLENLQKVYWLSLPTLVPKDGLLTPLAKMRSLKHLILSNKYKMEEVARLAGARPDIDCTLFNPVSEVLGYFTCKKCGKNQMILPTGKGMPLLCTICDAERINKHINAFNKTAGRSSE